MKKNTMRVYDTISKKIVEVEVSNEVRTHYNRTQWNIDDNDESFFKHEIQFSALIGGHENAFENFREFILFRTVFSGSSKMAETARTLSFDAFSWAAGLKRNGFFPDLSIR